MVNIPDDYRKEIENINANGEDEANNSMQDVYKDQKKSLDEVHTLIAMLFIKYGIDGLLKLTQTQKNYIFPQFNSKLKTMGENLGKNEVNKVSDILKNAYQDTYYKNIYTIEKNFSVNLKVNLLKQEFIDSAVNTKLSGKMFSDRIWDNKANLIDNLHQALVDISNGDTTIDKAGKLIQDIFNTTAYQTQRLMVTELTRTQAQAQVDVAKNTGVKKHMWSATLDSRTCNDCSLLDGKIFDIDDDSSPQMPLHPEDRCCWINIPNADWQPTKRKDNESKDIINYNDYSAWAEEKNITTDD